MANSYFTGGNISIGTTDSDEVLHVYGTSNPGIKLEAPSGQRPIFYFNSGDATRAQITFNQGDVVQSLIYGGKNTDQSITLQTSGSANVWKFTDSNELSGSSSSTGSFGALSVGGNVLNANLLASKVGINESAPEQALDVIGSIQLSDTLVYKVDASTKGRISYLSDGLKFDYGVTEGFRLDGSGNVIFQAANAKISGSSSSTGSFGQISIVDKIVHAGDTNTHIQFGTDEVKLRTGGSSRLIARDANVELYVPLVTDSNISGSSTSTGSFGSVLTPGSIQASTFRAPNNNGVGSYFNFYPSTNSYGLAVRNTAGANWIILKSSETNYNTHQQIFTENDLYLTTNNNETVGNYRAHFSNNGNTFTGKNTFSGSGAIITEFVAKNAKISGSSTSTGSFGRLYVDSHTLINGKLGLNGAPIDADLNLKSSQNNHNAFMILDDNDDALFRVRQSGDATLMNLYDGGVSTIELDADLNGGSITLEGNVSGSSTTTGSFGALTFGGSSQASAMSGSGAAVTGSGMIRRNLLDYEEGQMQTPLIINGKVVHRMFDASDEYIQWWDNLCYYIRVGNKVDVWYHIDTSGVNITEMTDINGSEVGAGTFALMLPYSSAGSYQIQNTTQGYINGSTTVVYWYVTPVNGSAHAYTDAGQSSPVTCADGEATSNRIIVRNHFTYHLF